MKTITWFVLLAGIILPGCKGCHYSKGFKKDGITGISYNYNGLGVKDIAVYDSNHIRRTSNKIAFGDKVVLVADGLTYFTEKSGRVFPGCSMIVTDPSGNQVYSEADLFAGLQEGALPDQAKMVTARFTTGTPMKKGEHYHLKVTVFDKLNQEQQLNADYEFVLQ